MSLADTVSLVTGASRGVGRGVAVGMAEAGATVYATGRTIANADLPAAPACAADPDRGLLPDPGQEGSA